MRRAQDAAAVSASSVPRSSQRNARDHDDRLIICAGFALVAFAVLRCRECCDVMPAPAILGPVIPQDEAPQLIRMAGLAGAELRLLAHSGKSSLAGGSLHEPSLAAASALGCRCQLTRGHQVIEAKESVQTSIPMSKDISTSRASPSSSRSWATLSSSATCWAICSPCRECADAKYRTSIVV